MYAWGVQAVHVDGKGRRSLFPTDMIYAMVEPLFFKWRYEQKRSVRGRSASGRAAGNMEQEVDEVIRWLTGYSQPELEGMLERPVSYGDFFRNAPEPNENRRLIKGVVCGVRVEDIEEPLMREIRYLDKLVDELARGKAMDKILRR